MKTRLPGAVVGGAVLAVVGGAVVAPWNRKEEVY